MRHSREEPPLALSALSTVPKGIVRVSDNAKDGTSAARGIYRRAFPERMRGTSAERGLFPHAYPMGCGREFLIPNS